MTAAGATDVERRRLRWRARRGLLENDLLVSRFLDRFEEQLEPAQMQALSQLLEVADNDLLELLLARAELPPALDSRAMRRLLDLMRAI
jgi:antitoxin CptB